MAGRLRSALPSGNLTFQMQVLAERTIGWDPQALESQITKQLAVFESACLCGKQCLELKVRCAFAGASIELENLQMARAFEHRDACALDAATRRYVASQYLHYRLLRCYFKKDRESDLYGLDFGGFGLATCAAIYVGAQKEARWLGVEYLRHFDAGYQCPFTLDEDFLRMCRWVTAIYLNSGSTEPSPTGLYEELPKAVNDLQSAADLLGNVHDRRTEKAYRRIVLEDESETNYYGHIFPALFPFEMLAFHRLVATRVPKSIELAHPAITHLSGVYANGGSYEDDFVTRSEARIAELEREVGLQEV